ncbi:hypothetical protein VOLCADRAFT_96472 [Volvox carteri f. nagariensis]|uniref:C2 domain-containing protein n=1 Tax=Volvox carteri f. nagariensis TaxID=3068 RepID=D8UA73_VOLCA|nr:uncharacterized protein VOLCADRAFT_96472 [Volvox carteri f. nagariensis]EFJ43375.1 hypothetical protein VOLCADRAFT_96472 [Volvox carteri f. nagariensis]|eukprot:XP_002955522.1 hypothetical protein VOLCADRAFT_96472 [Volvox carteri f. nagariensis]
MTTNSNVHLRVISGHELPKTDLFSHIDPYVEDFFFEAEVDDDGVLYGTLVLDLYDGEEGKNEHVGSIRLDLQTLSPETLLEVPLELPLVFKGDKRGQKLARSAPRARLALQVVALGKAFSSYVSELADAVSEAAAIVDDRSGTVLVAVPGTDDTLWAGLRFGPRSTQLLLLSTADPKAKADNPAVWYDMSYSGSPSLRVERLQYRKPVKMYGLKVWAEVRATNVPVDAKLSKVRILEREHRLVDTLDPADVLAGHGYMIGMPFLAAVKELSKKPARVHVDAAAQALWIRMDSNQPQPAQLLQLDYGEDVAAAAAAAAEAPAAAETSPGGGKKNGGEGGGGKGGKGGGVVGRLPALRICSTSSELNKGYELAFFGGGGRAAAGPMVTVSETFRRPKPVLGGMYDIVHSVELRDAFVGYALEEVGLGCYELMKPCRTWRLGKLLTAAARGELANIEEGGYGGGGRASGGVEGDADGAVDRIGSASTLVRSFLSWLPCMAPPRADAYREEELTSAAAVGDSKKARRGSSAKQEEVGEDDGRGAHGRRESRSRRGKDLGGADAGGAGGRRARSTGGGAEGAVASPLAPTPSSKSVQGSGGGPGRASRLQVAATASVGSSSDRVGSSTSLTAYNSSKQKYGGKRYGGSGGGGGDKLSSMLSSNRSGERGTRAELDELDDD